MPFPTPNRILALLLPAFLLAGSLGQILAQSDGAEPRKHAVSTQKRLHRALRQGDSERALKLLREGTDPGPALIVAAQFGRYEVVSAILELPEARKFPWIHIALAHSKIGEHSECERALIEAGADLGPSGRDAWGRSLVMRLLKTKRRNAVSVVLQAGADVDEASRNGTTALIEAAREGRLVDMEILLDAGAKMHAADLEGWTPLLWAVRSGPPEAVELLLAKGTNPNHRSHLGWSALELAAGQGALTKARALLEAGSDSESADLTGRTPLLCAIEGAHLALVDLLLGAGARPTPEVLEMAGLLGHETILTRLLEVGGMESP